MDFEMRRWREENSFWLNVSSVFLSKLFSLLFNQYIFIKLLQHKINLAIVSGYLVQVNQSNTNSSHLNIINKQRSIIQQQSLLYETTKNISQ